MKVSAIIVAAGSSRRMGFDKLAADIAGQSVLARSLAAFQHCADIDEIILVGSGDAVTAATSSTACDKLRATVPGGAERHLSVAAGLAAVSADTDLIAVHDGARPLITPSAITRCIDAASQHAAASLAHRITDTLKRATADEAAPAVIDSVSRENLWAMETPQIFSAQILRDAYQRILEGVGDRIVTDEVSAVEATGQRVVLVENAQPNPKVTFPADIPLCEALLKTKT